MRPPPPPASSCGNLPARFNAPSSPPFPAVARAFSAAALTADESSMVDLGHFVCRNFLTLLSATIIGLMLALAVTVSQAPVYRAAATIEIQDMNNKFLNL